MFGRIWEIRELLPVCFFRLFFVFSVVGLCYFCLEFTTKRRRLHNRTLVFFVTHIPNEDVVYEGHYPPPILLRWVQRWWRWISVFTDADYRQSNVSRAISFNEVVPIGEINNNNNAIKASNTVEWKWFLLIWNEGESQNTQWGMIVIDGKRYFILESSWCNIDLYNL